MKPLRIYILEGHRLLADQGRRADSVLDRTCGWLGKAQAAPGEALWIPRCNSIHTFFMRIPLDAVYTDKNLKVVQLVENMKPWRISLCRGGKHVAEMPAGSIRRLGLKVGETLLLEEGA